MIKTAGMIRPDVAAKILGVRPEKVRQWMRNNKVDLGLAISPESSGKTNWEYYIYPAKLEKIIGRSLEVGGAESDEESV